MVLKVGTVKAGNIEAGVHDDGLGLVVIAREAVAVGKVKAGQLLGLRVVEFPRDCATRDGIPIFVSRLSATHRAGPSGVRRVRMTRLFGQGYHSASIYFDADSVHERSPNAKCGGAVIVQGGAERVGSAPPARGSEKDGSEDQDALR